MTRLRRYRSRRRGASASASGSAQVVRSFGALAALAMERAEAEREELAPEDRQDARGPRQDAPGARTGSRRA